jgi:hypothetical protein
MGRSESSYKHSLEETMVHTIALVPLGVAFGCAIITARLANLLLLNTNLKEAIG